MKFGKFLTLLFLIYGTSFYLVRGQANNGAKSDCTLLYNFINGDDVDYSNVCCSGTKKVTCDKDGHIIYVSV